MEREETLLSPLLSLSSATGKFRGNGAGHLPTRSSSRTFNLSFAEGLPKNRSQTLCEVIQDFQDSLNLELNVLRKNNASDRDLDALFKTYRKKVLDYYKRNSNNSARLSKEGLSVPEPYPDDFLFDFALLSSSSGNVNIFGSEVEPCITNNLSHQFDIQTPFFSSDCKPMFGKKRHLIRGEAKRILENVFQVKRAPNASERKLIAERCHLSNSQVRIWFTNKRARFKHHHN